MRAASSTRPYVSNSLCCSQVCSPPGSSAVSARIRLARASSSSCSVIPRESCSTTCLLRRATAVSLPESEADGEAPPRADGRVAAPRQPWVLQVDGGEAVEHRGEGDGPFQPGERRAPAELGPRPKAKWRTSARSTSNRSGYGS